MRSILTVASIAVVVAASASSVSAESIYWSDEAVDYSSNIQNFAGTLMDASTTWWVAGAPEGDTGDFVGGWRSNAPGEYIVVRWDTPIADMAGDDIVIQLFSGGKAGADVFASVDGIDYTQIGTLGKGTASEIRQEWFDLDGQFASDVSYVKVVRTANGQGAGMFFDGFGAAVPEPATVALLAAIFGFIGICRHKRS